MTSTNTTGMDADIYESDALADKISARLNGANGTKAPPVDSLTTVTVADGRITITVLPRKSQRPHIEVRLDGAVIAMDSADISSERGRKALLKQCADEWHPEVYKGLLTLAANIVVASSPDRDTASAVRAIVTPVEPCDYTVDGIAVLASVERRLKRHVQLSDAAADAVPLWILLTYLVPVLPATPLLWIFSPTRGCGKSVLLELVALLSARSLKADNASLAALFRIAESHRPTILLDEVDQWLMGDRRGEISGLLNASFTRGGLFLRTVGDDHEPKGFDVFGFRAISGIGKCLQDTTRSRSLRIHMERAAADSLPEPLQGMYAEPWAKPLRAELARLADQISEPLSTRLQDASATKYPAFLDGRGRDLWLPLFAVADVLGGSWPDRIRASCTTMSRDSADDVADIGELLLLDCRRFFDETGTVEFKNATLLEWLIGQEASIWAAFKKGKPIASVTLSKRLKDFGISTEGRRVGTDKARWYHRDQFTEAFTRYLPQPVPVPDDPTEGATESGTQGRIGTQGTQMQEGGLLLFNDGKRSTAENPVVLPADLPPNTPVRAFWNGEWVDTTSSDPDLSMAERVEVITLEPALSSASGPGLEPYEWPTTEVAA